MARSLLLILCFLMILSLGEAFAQVNLVGALQGDPDRKVRTLLEHVTLKLPPRLVAALPTNLKITIRPLNAQTRLTGLDCRALPANTRFGQYSEGNATLTLDQALVDLYVASSLSPAQNCPQRTVTDYVTATIVHELFHAYDRSDRLSGDRMFRSIIQWQGKGENYRGTRTPDLYEQKNVREYAAVNFEHFLLDPDYQCRRPSHQKFYQEHFGHTPFPARCSTIKHVYDLSSGALVRHTLDPARIYQVHYLVSGPGARMDNRFGHSMLRLVVCAPARRDALTGQQIPATRMGPDCLRDSDFHLVVSFVANVEDFTIDNIRGLTGDYPSVLFVTPFSAKIAEVNQRGLRDLFSYPLNLNDAQKVSLIGKIVETYWDYSGSYYFLSNNCATETYDLLTAGIGDARMLAKNSVQPHRVTQDLIQLGYIDAAYRDIESMNLPYLYKGQGRTLGAALRTVNERAGNLPKDIIDYVEKPESYRTRLLSRIEAEFARTPQAFRDANKNRETRAKLSAIFLLEVHGMNHLFAKVVKAISDKAVEMRAELERAPELQRYIQALRVSPQTMARPGYGIPLERDLGDMDYGRFDGAHEDLHAYIISHNLVDLEGARAQTADIEAIIMRTSNLKESIQRQLNPGAQ